jgi:hypothetical protein
MPSSWSATIALLFPLLCAACGGSGSAPAAPTSPPAPTTVSVSGNILGNPSGSPMSGLAVSLGLPSPVTVTTDSTGAFAFVNSNPFVVSAPISIEGPGILRRDSQMTLSQSRNNIAIDVITTAPPFNYQYYKEFLRNGRDAPDSLQPLRPGTVPRHYYIKTTNENGVPVNPVVIAETTSIILSSVPVFTGGKLQATVETVADAVPSASGVFNVLFMTVLPDPSAGGQATVGGDSGTVWLEYDPNKPLASNYGLPNGAQCMGIASGAMLHEIVHSVGGWHVSDSLGPTSNPFSPYDHTCDGSHRYALPVYHMTLAYTRQPGNVDPDRDSQSFILSSPSAAHMATAPPIAVDSKEALGLSKRD